jgi:hypothetical protein
MASFIDMLEKDYYNYQDSPLFTELKRWLSSTLNNS